MPFIHHALTEAEGESWNMYRPRQDAHPVTAFSAHDHLSKGHIQRNTMTIRSPFMHWRPDGSRLTVGLNSMLGSKIACLKPKEPGNWHYTVLQGSISRTLYSMSSTNYYQQLCHGQNHWLRSHFSPFWCFDVNNNWSLYSSIGMWLHNCIKKQV